MVCSSGARGWSAPVESSDCRGEFGWSAPIGEYDGPVESMSDLLQSSVRMVCSNGEYGWSAPVESIDGLLQWRVWIVCSYWRV